MRAAARQPRLRGVEIGLRLRQAGARVVEPAIPALSGKVHAADSLELADVVKKNKLHAKAVGKIDPAATAEKLTRFKKNLSDELRGILQPEMVGLARQLIAGRTVRAAADLFFESEFNYDLLGGNIAGGDPVKALRGAAKAKAFPVGLLVTSITVNKLLGWEHAN